MKYNRKRKYFLIILTIILLILLILFKISLITGVLYFSSLTGNSMEPNISGEENCIYYNINNDYGVGDIAGFETFDNSDLVDDYEVFSRMVMLFFTRMLKVNNMYLKKKTQI